MQRNGCQSTLFATLHERSFNSHPSPIPTTIMHTHTHTCDRDKNKIKEMKKNSPLKLNEYWKTVL